MSKILSGNNFISIKNNEVYLDKVSILDLSKKYKTPFFIFLKKKIEENINLLKTALSKIFDSYLLYYSMKSNYFPDILKIIHTNNVPFEIISDFEYQILKKNNLNCNNLLIGGPYFPDDFIDNILTINKPKIVIYNIPDLIKLDHYFEKRNYLPLEIILRCRSPLDKGYLGIETSDKNLEFLISSYSKCKNLKIVGILSHKGTSKNNENTHVENAKFICQTAIKFETLGIQNIKEFNFGGGFPEASSFNFKKLLTVFNKIKNEMQNNGFKKITSIFEPGRYIVGDAGVCIMKVINAEYEQDTKKNNNILLDGGNHILPRFGKSPIRYYNLNKPISHYNIHTDIIGIMLSNDILTKNYGFTKCTIGDLILATNCGAYSYTFSNRFPYNKPQYVLLDGNEDILINDII